MLIKCTFNFVFLLPFVWDIGTIVFFFFLVKAQEMEPYMPGASTCEMRYQSIVICCLTRFLKKSVRGKAWAWLNIILLSLPLSLHPHLPCVKNRREWQKTVYIKT